MSRVVQQIVYTLLFGIELYTAVSSLEVNANSGTQLQPSSDQHSIEILALSRGHGVPEKAAKAMQDIIDLAKAARESGKAISVKQETIGLEGETRLCIVFQNDQALVEIGCKIRKLATNIELMQVNDNCYAAKLQNKQKG